DVRLREARFRVLDVVGGEAGVDEHVRPVVELDQEGGHRDRVTGAALRLPRHELGDVDLDRAERDHVEPHGLPPLRASSRYAARYPSCATLTRRKVELVSTRVPSEPETHSRPATFASTGPMRPVTSSSSRSRSHSTRTVISRSPGAGPARVSTRPCSIAAWQVSPTGEANSMLKR